MTTSTTRIEKIVRGFVSAQFKDALAVISKRLNLEVSAQNSKDSTFSLTTRNTRSCQKHLSRMGQPLSLCHSQPQEAPTIFTRAENYSSPRGARIPSRSRLLSFGSHHTEWRVQRLSLSTAQTLS